MRLRDRIFLEHEYLLIHSFELICGRELGLLGFILFVEHVHSPVPDKLMLNVQLKLVLFVGDAHGKARSTQHKFEILGSHLLVELREDFPEPVFVLRDIFFLLRSPIFLRKFGAIFEEIVLSDLLEVLDLVRGAPCDPFNHWIEWQVRNRVKFILEYSPHSQLNRSDLLGELLEIVLNPGLDFSLSESVSVLHQFVLHKIVHVQPLPDYQLPERLVKVQTKRLHGQQTVRKDRSDYL